MQEALQQSGELTVNDRVQEIVRDVDHYKVPKFNDIVLEYRGVYGDALDAQARGEAIDEGALAELQKMTDLDYWRDPDGVPTWREVLSANTPKELGINRAFFKEFQSVRKQDGKRADFRAFQTYAYKLVKLAEEIDSRLAEPEIAKQPEDTKPQEVTAESPLAAEVESPPATSSEANNQAGTTTETPAGRRQAAKRKPEAAADRPLKVPEADKPKRKVSHRTLASIGGLAALTEVADMVYEKNGATHFYGVYSEGGKEKFMHISKDAAHRWYTDFHPELIGHDDEADTLTSEAATEADGGEVTDLTDGDGASADVLAWLGVSAAEYNVLSSDELKDKWRDAIARDKETAQREIDQKAAEALRAAEAAAAAAAIPAPTPVPAPAPEPAGRTMVSPPPRPSRWQQFKDAPHRWAIRSKEWVLDHKGTSGALGGLAVVAAGVGIYFLTKDHNAVHEVVGGTPTTGGGSSAHETVQQTVSSGGSGGQTSESAQQTVSTSGTTAPSPSGHETTAGPTTHTGLIAGPGSGDVTPKGSGAATDSRIIAGGQSGGIPKGSGSATDPNLIAGPSGHRVGGRIPAGATSPDLISGPSGHAGGGNVHHTGATNTDLTGGHGVVTPEKLPHGVTLSLHQGGDNIWREVTHYLTANGYAHNDVAVDTVKDAVLKHMHLTEAAATNLPVGYHFTIPRAVLEELLKIKK